MVVETSWFAWLLLGLCFFTYSSASIKISNNLPWSTEARKAALPFFAGLALSPFLLGMMAILVLGLLPGSKHSNHLLIILIAPFLSLWLKKPTTFRLDTIQRTFEIDEKIVFCIIMIGAMFLIFNALMFPLTQNDSLEYATVGRTLYETRHLMDYSVLSPERTISGFYAPWTHPPLYVSLIYATYLLQAQDTFPHLMRIISPWFALLSVGLTYAAGNFVRRRLGLYAAVLLISTPIIFLGADSGLIDAIPMLGLLLIFTCVIGLETTPIKAGFIQGIALGLALWTHSQAILFIPLSIVMTILAGPEKQWVDQIKKITALLLTGLLIAFLPYAHNLQLYGVLISDTNPIYALPVLKWNNYFKYARELNSTAAIIQYGIFKGWFMLEYYGIIFWLMTISAIYFCYQFLSFSSVKKYLIRTRLPSYPYPLVISLGIIITYLGGVVASILLGIDLMIRNERYLLIIFPYVALLASWLCSECVEKNFLAAQKRKTFLGIATMALISLLPILTSLQLFTFLKYRFNNNNVSLTTVMSPQAKKLLNSPSMLAMDFLNHHTPENALVLSSQPADMYYVQRKMVSYLDPRLIPFYLAKNPNEAASHLKAIGISYIHLTDYSLPIFYNSSLMYLLSDPTMSTLAYSAGANQIYHLENSSLNRQPQQNIAPASIPWIKFKQFVFMQNKINLPYEFPDWIPTRIDYQGVSKSSSPLGIFQRNFSTTLITESAVKVKGGNEYILDFSIFGEGYLDFFIIQYDKSGAPLKNSNFRSSNKMLIGNLVLDMSKGNFIRRIQLLPKTDFLQIGIEQHGNSTIAIEKAQLISLKRN